MSFHLLTVRSGLPNGGLWTCPRVCTDSHPLLTIGQTSTQGHRRHGAVRTYQTAMQAHMRTQKSQRRGIRTLAIELLQAASS